MNYSFSKVKDVFIVTGDKTEKIELRESINCTNYGKKLRSACLKLIEKESEEQQKIVNEIINKKIYIRTSAFLLYVHKFRLFEYLPLAMIYAFGELVVCTQQQLNEMCLAKSGVLMICLEWHVTLLI